MATRGRPKSNSSKVSDNTSSEVKADVNVVTSKTNLGGSTEFAKDLTKDQLLEILAKLLQEKVQPTPVEEKKEDEYSYEEDEFNAIKINQDDYIKVISLNPFELNLSTQGGGRGRIFTFKTFGSTKRILYSDLVQIMENYQHFLNDGLFYIADQRVIRRHGLDDAYSRILTEPMIKKILDGTTTQDAISIIKSASPRQQEVIAQMFIDRRLENPESIDLNMWDKIERATGIPMQEKYESTKQYLDFMEERKEQSQ